MREGGKKKDIGKAGGTFMGMGGARLAFGRRNARVTKLLICEKARSQKGMKKASWKIKRVQKNGSHLEKKNGYFLADNLCRRGSGGPEQQRQNRGKMAHLGKGCTTTTILLLQGEGLEEKWGRGGLRNP